MRVLFSRGDLDIAEKYIRELNHFIPIKDLSPWITNQMAAWQARIWLAQGQLESAAQWAEKCEPDIEGELIPLHDFDYVVLARILIAQGRLEETTRLLQRLFEEAEAGGRISKAIEIQTLQALAIHAGDETDRALSVLERALGLAEPGGFVRIFVDEGRPMARLLHEALNQGIAPEYVRQLLAAFPTVEQEKTTSAKTPSAVRRPPPTMVEPLSERELEVLQHVAKGLTNREIADQLYLSLNTVKVHTRNIYGKLGEHSRTQAIARSQELGLLPPKSL
jgi:LuxR family maltose regulon positive regulatory protein